MKKGNQETLDLLVCVLGLLTFGLYFLIRGIWNAFGSEEEEQPHYAEKDTCEEETPQTDQKVGAFFLHM